MHERKIKHIVLQFSMIGEAIPFIKGNNLEEILDFPTPLSLLSNTKVYRKFYSAERIITVVVAGEDLNFKTQRVGTVNAAQLATLITLSFKNMDILINAGTAGYLIHREDEEQNIPLPKIYISNGFFYFHDRRINISAMPEYSQYGKGPFLGCSIDGIANKLGLQTTAISTSDSIDITEAEEQVLRENNIRIVDMESAAIVQAVTNITENDMPVTAVKVVSNRNGLHLNNIAHQEFADNFEISTHLLASTLTKICNNIFLVTPNQLNSAELFQQKIDKTLTFNKVVHQKKFTIQSGTSTNDEHCIFNQ